MRENDEDLQLNSLPDQLTQVSGTLHRLADETDRLKTLAAENAEALDMGVKLQRVADDRMKDLKREYEALRERYRVGQQSWHMMNERLALADEKVAALEASRSVIADKLQELNSRAIDAEETALLLSDALCAML